MDWSVILDKVAENISKPAFETWFKNTEIEIKDDDIVFIKSNNSFSKDWLETRYKDLIFESIREVTGRTYEIEFISSESQVFSTYPNDRFERPLDRLEKLVEEQGELIMQQQEKIKELEKRIYQLEQS